MRWSAISCCGNIVWPDKTMKIQQQILLCCRPHVFIKLSCHEKISTFLLFIAFGIHSC